MHVQDCISNNISGEIAKQEITSCSPGRYTRGLHCQIIFVMQHQALNCHATSRKPFFQVVLNRIGILWVVVRGFGWFCWWL